MKSTLMRCRVFSPASSSMIWRWMVTSSAVVGSSAMSSLGSQASAMAIITRCCCPPDISCGYDFMRRCGSGIPTSPSSASARAQAARRPRRMCLTSGSQSCWPTLNTGLSELIGSWKTHAISLPRSACSSGILACSRSRPCHITRPLRSALSGSRLSTDIAVTLLPEPDSPTSATVRFSGTSKLTPTFLPATTRPTACARWPWPMRKATLRSWMLSSMSLIRGPAAWGRARRARRRPSRRTP